MVFVVVAALTVFAHPSTAATLTVDSTGDAADSSPGDGTCGVPNGGCTLRAAIQESNALAGADLINFSIGGTPSITVLSELPAIADAVTVDGTSQPGFTGSPVVELSGGNTVTNGLTIQSGDVSVRGLVINR
ncbi:MAG TPA: CSLREA domain-containing protein, partial [Actinomycetota bacterium]|nr:CSLREA domain-containing protein [Actinomycetota bacterium]